MARIIELGSTFKCFRSGLGYRLKKRSNKPTLLSIILRNPTVGAFIGELCALVYTLHTAYVSYI